MTSEVLTVPTAFGDLSELSEGLADRVDEERIILYGPSPFSEGETVGFAVLLMDGTEALTGVGRVAAAVDGGEERAPETRFDIVFDSLQLDGRSEVVYERIVLARQSLYGADPATGEVSLEDLEAEVSGTDAAYGVGDDVDGEAALDPYAAGGDDALGEEPSAEAGYGAEPEGYGAEEAYASADEAYEVPAEPAADAAEAEVFASFTPSADELGAEEPGGWEDAASEAFDDAGFDEPVEGATVVGSVESLRPSSLAAPSGAPPPALPSAPAGFRLQAPPGGVLTRPMAPATWWPEATPVQARPSTGHFQYGDTLPIPAAPPRPTLDPSLRVSPAPRPGDRLQPPAPPSLPPTGAAMAPATEAVALDDALGDDALGDDVEASDDVDAFLDAGGNDDAADPNDTYDINSDAPDAYELEGGTFDDLEAETQHAVELPEDDR
ncbi:MAG: hypothetical protein KF901_08150 [Myxococcales bacterium]|nr:hypothetical protein [Myxococcales bacterium]